MVETPQLDCQVSHKMFTRSHKGIIKPNPKYFVGNHTLNITKPSKISEALQSPQWKQAMEDEYKALCKNNT